MMKLTALLSGFLVALALVACGGNRETAVATPGATSQQIQPAGAVSTEYRLGPGDKLRITVFGHQDMSGEFVLDGSGNIALPLVGQFKAGALTVTELQEALQKTFNKDYIVDPKISVEVLNYRPFFILGEVSRPGSYPYVTGIDVLQAVALGGGFTRRARTSSVTIIRDHKDGGRMTLTAEPSAAVLPGDTITVERRLF